MSSSSNEKNITISLFKVKFLSENIKEYNIYVDYSGESKSTEMISSKEYNFSPLTFTFPFNNSNNTIKISAYASTWLLLSSKIASISIPLSLNKLNSQRQWYYMKNENEENLISILISFSMSNITNRLVNKTDISINDNIINTNTSAICSMLNRTVIPRHVSYESNKMNNSYYTFSNVFDVINEKNKKLNEYEEKIKMQKLNNDLNIEKLKDREGILKREGRKLLEKSKKYQLKELEYDTKCIKISQKMLKLEKDIERFDISKDINEYNTEFFSNINFIYTTNVIDIDRYTDKSLLIKITHKERISTKKEPFTKKFHIQGSNNPSKKSNSTNITSNTSDLSYNDFSKFHLITHIDLSNITDDIPNNRVIETLETEPNVMKKANKEKSKQARNLKSAKRRNSNISSNSKSNKQSIISMSSHKSNINKTIPHGINSIITVSKFSNRGSKVKKT